MSILSRLFGKTQEYREDTPAAADPADFRHAVLAHQRETRELVLESGDPGARPITKIGGVPFWPKGVPRPRCELGHPMSFVLQVMLGDVPQAGPDDSGLVSVHYCDQCTPDGRMSFGWSDPTNQGYSVDIFEGAQTPESDGLGSLAPGLLPESAVSFRTTMEVPSIDDLPGEVGNLLPIDFPQNQTDFDEVVYPGLVHVMRSKVGGWPSWIQSSEWPWPHEQSTIFVCQLDYELGQSSPWAGGGYLYLFVSSDEAGSRSGEICIQTT